jgi:hypothetical protein
MSKVNLSNIPSLVTAPGVINTNNQRIEDEFDKVLYRDGTAPNGMLAPLDMNGFRVINLPVPQNPSDAARKLDIDNAVVIATSVISTTEASRLAAEAAATLSETARDESVLARDKARQWAEEDLNVEVEPSEYSAKHYSIIAEGHSLSAANSANLLNSPDYGFIADLPTDTTDFGSIV